jgi:hypothetical protein
MLEPKRSVVAFDQLPPSFPTQAHAPAFWEALGRAVATFGFLEETLGKAIFAYTGMREIPEEQINAAYEKWILTLQHVERGVAELACEVINTVTHMGWQFPGSSGPGITLIQADRVKTESQRIPARGAAR